jgi:hypothetical protein
MDREDIALAAVPRRLCRCGRRDERIHIPTRVPDAGPIVQCKAEVGDIKSLLKESTA